LPSLPAYDRERKNNALSERRRKNKLKRTKGRDASHQHGEGGDRFVDGFFFHSIRRGRVVVCTHISSSSSSSEEKVLLFDVQKIEAIFKTLNAHAWKKIQKSRDAPTKALK